MKQKATIKTWIGLAMFLIGIILLFYEQSKNMAPLVIGFGIGATLSSFKYED